MVGFVGEVYFVGPFCFDACLTQTVFFCISSSSKSTRALLVHFSTRSNTINCKVNEFGWLYNANHFVSVSKDVFKYFEFRAWLGSTVLRVCARMNDAVHVEIQVFDHRIVCFGLISLVFAQLLGLI